jgi:hypothetical protein
MHSPGPYPKRVPAYVLTKITVPSAFQRTMALFALSTSSR